ncbi:saccharopine dehydrogenase, partial [Candidatus Bathyarchaeota archaeon]|nr:saccharopine dehydrogenase [Candidatus Bathyarchaeota archaeon]
MTLDERAIEAGVTIIPDCGVAPGLSNMLVGRSAQKLDEVHSIHILVGGIPARAEPPLGYTITWSPEDLLDEYTRKVRIVRDGMLTEVEPLTGLENMDLPGVGTLEAFYTDGLRTLLRTVKAREMWEKTLRYPGHVEKIRLLRDLGFLDGESIEIEGLPIPIKRLTARILERKLYRPKVEDVLVMKVEVSGIRGGEDKRYTHYLLDRYDKERGITAMARTTAYTAAS